MENKLSEKSSKYAKKHKTSWEECWGHGSYSTRNDYKEIKDAFIAGSEYMLNETIEWIKMNVGTVNSNVDNLIEEYKKSMKYE